MRLPRAELEVKDSFQGDSKNVISSNLAGDLAMENLTGASLDQTITGALENLPSESIRNENQIHAYHFK